MVTRFYFPSSGSPSVSPTYDADWEQTGEADRVLMSTTKTNTALTNKTVTVPITTLQQILARQFVSAPLSAQTFSGSFNIVIRCSEAASGADAYMYVISRTYNPNTGVFQTLRGAIIPGTEFPLTASAATRGPALNYGVTGITVADGDVMVIEIGVYADAPSAASTGTLRFGDNNASDFALTSGLTTDLNPWMEFSMDIAFQSTGGPANLKSYNTNVKANIKSINTNVIANVKSLNTNV